MKGKENLYLFTFYSAGGIGVILNLDRLARRLQMAALKVQVRGLADSGWYIDLTDCTAGGKQNCLPAQPQNAAMILQGMRYVTTFESRLCLKESSTVY